jgi:hypothetical protein
MKTFWLVVFELSSEPILVLLGFVHIVLNGLE